MEKYFQYELLRTFLGILNFMLSFNFMVKCKCLYLLIKQFHIFNCEALGRAQLPVLLLFILMKSLTSDWNLRCSECCSLIVVSWYLRPIDTVWLVGLCENISNSKLELSDSVNGVKFIGCLWIVGEPVFERKWIELWGAVAHAFNPSYLGGRQENHGSRLAGAKKLDPVLKNKPSVLGRVCNLS
jgi:hypothetical protein